MRFNFTFGKIKNHLIYIHIETYNNDLDTPLIEGIRTENVEIVELLLNLKASIYNSSGKVFFAWLNIKNKRNQDKIISLLLKAHNSK